jgi:hypothetical protein
MFYVIYSVSLLVMMTLYPKHSRSSDPSDKRNTKHFYYVKWLGYEDESDNTWEPAV